MPDITIRRLTISDAASAAELEKLCFSQPWSKKVYEETLAGDNTYYYGAFLNEEVLIGTVGLLDVLGEGEISNVAVHPTYRRRGIADALLRQTMQTGRKMGIYAFTLEVRAGNGGAISLYKKYGFVSAGTRPGFYVNPKEDALIMWCKQKDGIEND